MEREIEATQTPARSKIISALADSNKELGNHDKRFQSNIAANTEGLKVESQNMQASKANQLSNLKKKQELARARDEAQE